MSDLTNPFRPAEQVAPKVKCLIYGTAGVGKTYFALTAPGKVAVIDTEGGTSFYANRAGTVLSTFDVLPTKTFAQVEHALAYLKSVPDEYAALVIDPVTVLYETLQDAALRYRTDKAGQRARARQEAFDADNVDLEQLDWQRIKRAYKRLMTDLVNLPVHVIVVAREADLTEERMEGGRKQRVKIGSKPDAEKSTPYYFDTLIHLVPGARSGREAIIEKDRTGTLELGARIPNPTFERLFSQAIAVGGSGTRKLQSEEDAARIDASMTMSAEELAEREETLRSLGEVSRTGTVTKGDGLRSNLEPRQTPYGMLVGFRLNIDREHHIPQVVAQGLLGAQLIEERLDGLLGSMVTVEGEVFEVSRPGRRSFHRLVLSSIAGPDWAIPARESTGEGAPSEAADRPSSQPTAEPSAANEAELDSLPVLS